MRALGAPCETRERKRIKNISKGSLRFFYIMWLFFIAARSGILPSEPIHDTQAQHITSRSTEKFPKRGLIRKTASIQRIGVYFFSTKIYRGLSENTLHAHIAKKMQSTYTPERV